MTTFSGTPFALAVLKYSLFKISNIALLVILAICPHCINAIVVPGNTRYFNVPISPTSAIVLYPHTGNHPNFTANISIIMIATQKLGAEIPASEIAIESLSAHFP